MSEVLEAPAIDRTGWPAGPWDTEPDRVEWQHAGYACLIVRHCRLGHLCGYVGIDEQHPDFGKPYNDVEAEDVHGGLTYASECSGVICHVPAPGMPDKVWWLGFDFAHAGDLSPGILAIERQFAPLRLSPEVEAALACIPDDVYRDLAYVQAETEALAEALRAKAS